MSKTELDRRANCIIELTAKMTTGGAVPPNSQTKSYQFNIE